MIEFMNEEVVSRSVWQNAPLLFYDMYLMLVHPKIWVGVHPVFMNVQTVDFFFF
jgi:hypothetical protein